MSASQYPPPPIPPIDGRLLGKPPRSMLIRCAMHDFSMTEAQAAAMVDGQIAHLGLEDEVDLAR
ncbi:MAG: hypothetical protein ACOY5U_09420 [Pseudomonadota bacterium]